MNENKQNKVNKPKFLTVVEVPQFNASIYITDEQIVVQDFDDKTNGLIIPWQKFKDNALLNKSSKDDDKVEAAAADAKRTIDFIGADQD